MQRYLPGFLLVVTLLYASVDARAQLYSANHGGSLTVDYFSSIGIDDTAYLYQGTPAVLKALSPDSTGGWEMRWQYLDTAAQAFINRMTVTDSVAFDTISQSGCYQVIMSKDTLEYYFRAWALVIDKLDIINPHKTPFDTLTSSVSTCNQVLIRLQTNVDNWMYEQLDQEGDSIFPTGNKLPFNLTDLIEVDWSSTTENEYNIPQTNGLVLADNSPPPVNTTYYASAQFIGFTDIDTAHLKAIATEAHLRADAVDYAHLFYVDSLGTSEELMQHYPNYASLFSMNSGPAPLWVEFGVDESENANEFRIEFGDTLSFKDSTFFDIDHVIYRRYDEPKEYEIVLTTISKAGCRSETAPVTITVDDADIVNLPNVFIAGGENVFRIEDISYRHIHVQIFNRWGNRMHEYKGDIKDWTGWDGKIRNSDNYAHPGVYFYVIRAVNWHPSNHPTASHKAERQGFFHLFRAE